MCFLKRLLPFSLTLIVGLTVGAFTNLLRLIGNHNVPASVSASEPRPGTSHCFSAIEEQALGSLSYGLGSAYHEVIRVEFDKQPAEVEEQISGRGEIIYYENKQKDAKILYLPAPSYWRGEHDFKHCDDVVLRATLNSSGEVTEISPVVPAQSAEHEQSAMAAAGKIRFDPSVDKYGQKVPQKVAILYRY